MRRPQLVFRFLIRKKIEIKYNILDLIGRTRSEIGKNVIEMFPAKIRGLNRDTSDESTEDEEENPTTKEALEQRTQQRYKDALVLQKQNKLQEAERILLDLLQSEVLVKSNGKVNFVNGRPQPSLFHLKYCCYLNLGNVLSKLSNYSAALEYYLKATELDDTDLNLWFKIGTVASMIPNLVFAVYAYTETLRRNIRHWPSLDAIITATYVTGDFMACLLFICHSLKLDSSYVKGLVLRDLIFKEHPFLRRDFEIFYPDCFNQLNVEKITEEDESTKEILIELNRLKVYHCTSKKEFEKNVGPDNSFLEDCSKALKSHSWLCLGRLLLRLHKSLLVDADDKLFSKPLKLHSYPQVHSDEVVSTEILPAIFESHLASEKEEENGEVRVESCFINEFNDDEDVELVTIPGKSNESDRGENADGGSKPKRRKCSPTLADQLKIGDKRRSTRNKTVLKNNEPSLSKILQQLIPHDLLPQKDKLSNSNFYDILRWNEDSFDTMDIYQLLFEHHELSNIPSYPINQFNEDIRLKLLRDENYFGTNKERKDIDWFLRINNELSVLELLEIYLRDLASKWCYTWPVKLTELYIEMYQILLSHGFLNGHVKLDDISQTPNGLNDESVKTLKERLNVVILYGELLLNQYFESIDRSQVLGNCFLGGNFSSLLIGDMHDACSLLGPLEKNMTFWMRAYWLEALIFLQKRDTFATCSALSMLVEEIPNSSFEIRLPNMKHFHVISLTNAKRLLNTLNRNQNLSEVKPLLSMKQYDRVVDILRETLKPDCQELMHLPNETTLSRYEQYNLLLTALWESKNYVELFEWCEITFYEAFVIYRKSFFDEIEPETKSNWASLVINALNCMFSCLKIVGLSVARALKPERLSRLVQTLSNLVCHQIEASEPSPEIISDVVTPWILLANLIEINENFFASETSMESCSEIAASSGLSLLFVAHEHLGRRSWCCFNDGALLFYTLNIIESLFKICNASWSDMWTTLSQQIDQIFHCLYSHPFKKIKPRHVQDHNSLGLALTWNRAVQAYSFYRPTTLPTFDAVSKFYSISGDTETLLKRMTSLLPENRHPARFVESVHQYLCGLLDVIPQNENPLPLEVADLFYLLADYYFKNKIMGKAIKYYLLDICSNPRRIDSWSAMALARGSQLEMKLNSCETISSESDILKKAELTDKCYKTALDLDSTQSTLWIEYGVFCYAVHAFCSRLLKQETTNLSLQMFEMLENQKEKFLNTSYHCFNSANEAWITLTSKHEEVQDERWLHHYMLGKIGEKREEKIEFCLNHYYQASNLLYKNGAEYPNRILYSSPQYYSVEALEIYYRVHASILKILEVNEEKPLDHSTIAILKRYIERMAESPFISARIKTSSNKGNDKTVTDEGFIKQNSISQNSNHDVREIMEEILEKVVGQTYSSYFSKSRVNDFSAAESEQRFETSNIGAERSPNVDEIELKDSVEEFRLTASSTDEEECRNKKKSNEPKIDVLSELNSPIRPSSDSSSCDSYSDSSNTGTELIADDLDDEVKNKTFEGETTSIFQNQRICQKTRLSLIKACINALEECARRFPEHYKSFYRLAHHYFRSKLDSNIDRARRLLIEDGGLFADRTCKNFFGGIWRIPTGEIDRPGSFAFHMSRSVHLLMDVLRDTRDYKTLLQLSDRLRCKPDLDKKYLRDNEREQLSKDAFSLSAQTVRNSVERVSGAEREPIKRELLLDVYRCYVRVCKKHASRDAPFARSLRAIYRKYTGAKEQVAFEQILAFCKSVEQIARSEPAANVAALLEAAVRAEKDEPAIVVIGHQPPDDAATTPTPTATTTQAPIATHADTKTQPAAKARSPSAAAAFASSAIPSNLKNLSPAVTVTTVPTAKSKVAPQAPRACDKSGAEQQTAKTRHCVIVRPGAAAAATATASRDRTKMSPVTGDPLADVGSPPCAGTGLAKIRTTRPAEPAVGAAGWTMGPAAADEATTATTASVNPASASSSSSTAARSVYSKLAAVNMERPGLTITAVPGRAPPSLQQMLAAKQMGRGAAVRLSSPSTNSEPVAGLTGAADRASFSAAQLSKQLGSSGVCIFAVPSDSAVASSAAAAAPTVASPAVHSEAGCGAPPDVEHEGAFNRYVARETDILSHFQSTACGDAAAQPNSSRPPSSPSPFAPSPSSAPAHSAEANASEAAADQPVHPNGSQARQRASGDGSSDLAGTPTPAPARANDAAAA